MYVENLLDAHARAVCRVCMQCARQNDWLVTDVPVRPSQCYWYSQRGTVQSRQPYTANRNRMDMIVYFVTELVAARCITLTPLPSTPTSSQSQHTTATPSAAYGMPRTECVHVVH